MRSIMAMERLEKILTRELSAIDEAGVSKREEHVITGIAPAQAGKGPRYFLKGHGSRPFLRMNSNGYLGMALQEEVRSTGEDAVKRFGAGPCAVRFISGTYEPHVRLEKRLAEFHGREAGMIFSSAYAAVMAVLPALITEETAVISDELNHNCIINATRLARPREKVVYPHGDLTKLEAALLQVAETCRRALVVTDGVFSMRGDHAPLAEISQLIQRCDSRFVENCILMVDDSHGVGAFGETGRGTEEVTASAPVEVLVATLGKALGVNGGYVVGSRILIDYLREKAPFYIYSNPITPGEAAAARKALDLLDSEDGRARLERVRTLGARLRQGLVGLGYETMAGVHPVVPLILRDTQRTIQLVQQLINSGVLATGLSFPVVPRGQEEIRFQVSAEHTEADIDELLSILARRPFA